MLKDNIFQKIIDKQIPAKIAYEDATCLAFHDVNPQAPTHVLIVPKRVLSGVAAAEEGDEPLLGHLLVVAKNLAGTLGLTHGYRLVINQGNDGGQTVNHLHIHLLGGRALTWPPG